MAIDDGVDDPAIDEGEPEAGGVVQSGVGEAIDIAQATGAGLVEQGEGAAAEDLAIAASSGEAVTDVLSGVVGHGGAAAEAAVDAAPQGAIAAEVEPVPELGQAYEHEGEQGAGVPAVVGEDVQVIEGVLVQQMRLVDEEHGVSVLPGHALDVLSEGWNTAAAVALGCRPMAWQSWR